MLKKTWVSWTPQPKISKMREQGREERGRTGGGPGNANDPFLLPSPSVLALEVQQQGNLAWGSRRGAAAAVRKDRGDLEGGGSSSEKGEGRSRRGRQQQ